MNQKDNKDILDPNLWNNDENLITITRTWIKEELENNWEEVVVTPELLEEITETLWEKIGMFVTESIDEAVRYRDIVERGKNIGEDKPYFIVKYRHPNAFIYDWKEAKTRFKTEADAQAYIRYNCGHGIDEEWKVEEIK